MRSARSFNVPLSWGTAIIVLLVSAPRGVAQTPSADVRSPSVLEEALAAYSCDSHGARLDEARYQCIDERVAALRGDFGYDLGRLSPAERQAIDTHCSRYQASTGHDAYMPCVNGELAKLRDKYAPKNAGASAASADASPLSTDATGRNGQPRSLTIWLLFASALAALAAAALVAGQRIKAARHKCRTCGAKAPPPSDLCADCRKRAAEALRQAAAERADRERAEREERRRREEEQDQRAREEEVARQQLEMLERQRALENERRRREAEARAADARATAESSASESDGADADEIFDPYTVLGVSFEAGRNAINTAYEQARAKYDAELVAHLGDEVQAHYRMKAEAVERAYQMLTAS